jgi:LytS/YehU family sensor histidine kinase
MLKKYMELELIRVKNGFDNEITIDSSVEEEITKVPPLVLQPIVENAIWHGIAGRPGKGKISIHVRAEKKLLLCEIENHCEGTRPSGEEHQPHKRKSFGLQITRERISLLSKGKNIKGFLNMLPLQDGMKVQIGIPV